MTDLEARRLAASLIRRLTPPSVIVEEVTWGVYEPGPHIRLCRIPACLFLKAWEVVDRYDILGEEASDQHYVAQLYLHHLKP